MAKIEIENTLSEAQVINANLVLEDNKINASFELIEGALTYTYESEKDLQFANRFFLSPIKVK